MDNIRSSQCALSDFRGFNRSTKDATAHVTTVWSVCSVQSVLVLQCCHWATGPLQLRRQTPTSKSLIPPRPQHFHRALALLPVSPILFLLLLGKPHSSPKLRSCQSLAQENLQAREITTSCLSPTSFPSPTLTSRAKGSSFV